MEGGDWEDDSAERRVSGFLFSISHWAFSSVLASFLLSYSGLFNHGLAHTVHEELD